MKKTLALLLTLALSMAALTGCGSKTDAPAADSTDSTTGTETPAALSGSVSTNGSTSMEKVIGILSEQFMADNSGVSVTYDPTGSGAGIEAASNGSADIGLSSRALKDEEIAGGLLDTACVKAFRVPAGTLVEVYATTLHYAPCSAASGAGFQVVVVLPRGTNGPKPDLTPLNGEDETLTACNKWLLAHPDSDEAKGGAKVGLRGENIDIANLL